MATEPTAQPTTPALVGVGSKELLACAEWLKQRAEYYQQCANDSSFFRATEQAQDQAEEASKLRRWSNLVRQQANARTELPPENADGSQKGQT